MATTCDDTFLKNQAGTSQAKRLQYFLNPDNIELQDINLEEWMRLAYNFAQYVNFFKTEDPVNPSGNWQAFFPDLEAAALHQFLNDKERDKNLTPHLTLFVCFLKLLSLSRKRFNSLTRKHLDFYYQQILQIPKLRAQPDQVHIIFELAKNLAQTKIDQFTSLDGGKDLTNVTRVYKTQEDLILNKAQVASLKSVYHQQKTDNNHIKVAEVTNSWDGLGSELKEDKSWWPFGYTNTFKNRPALPDATLGFAIAAPVLKMQEGTREVLITLICDAPVSIDIAVLIEHLHIYITGKEGWIGPLSPTQEDTEDFKTQQSGNTLNIAFSIPDKELAVIGFDTNIHKGFYDTAQPVVRFTINYGSQDAYNLGQTLAALALNETSITVKVSDIANLEMENDIGVINSKKPFYPFGTRPHKKSNFKINYPELFLKKWLVIQAQFTWLNLPTSFSTLYAAYTDVVTVNNNDHFDATVHIENSDTSNHYSSYKLFNNVSTAGKNALNLINTFDYKPGEGPIKLSLKKSFYHDIYPRLYALAISEGLDVDNIPYEPYTPFLETVNLTYTATQKYNHLTQTQDDEVAPIQFFHIHPFGVVTEDKNLFPFYEQGGQFYIGLQDALPSQTISLLIQLLEGTENTEVPPFEVNEKIAWHILIDNHWQTLNTTSILANNTDNFLQTGIIKFVLPAETSLNHTLMPSGLVWLRASMHKDYDAVCRFIHVHTQAVRAALENNNNELTHLTNGLEAETISKLSVRTSSVKKVNQLYSSFNGKPEESQANYYRRISERLRHKDRAVSLWDYEHLVLEKFPEIYKVKCLNHTCCNFLSPGKVTLVVIPDIVNQNVYDLFEPRVSKAKLNSIMHYINARNTLFVLPKVINPEYEPVKVYLKAKFKVGFDEHYYRNQLDTAIKKFLSPWAYSETAQIVFGINLHKSLFIKYLEDLNYIDYLVDVKLEHQGEFKIQVQPSNPKAILVSAKTHGIEPVVNPCATPSENFIINPC